MRSYCQEDIKGKRVLLRVDFNVDIEEGRIVDPSRIIAHLPTIKQLLCWEPEMITVVSHLTLPFGNFPLAPVASYLHTNAFPGEEFCVDNQPLPLTYHFSPRLAILENVRILFPNETKNDIDVGMRLASLGEVFVLDALSVSHRKHSSVYGVTSYLPSFAGPLLTHEVEVLSNLSKNPARPLLVIVGGAKLESKGPVIRNLLPVADKILVGGKVGYELKASGEYANEPKVVLPSEDSGKDIGPITIERFIEEIKKAETILWAGPMGKVEEPPFDHGTGEIGGAIAQSHAYKVVAGGDTQKALVELGLAGNMDFISQGGGATLKFLSGEKLPGLEGLGYY